MTSAFVFALLTNRAFLADWQTPFPLETIFNLPNINWSHDSLKEMGLRPHTTFGCVVDYLFRPSPTVLSFITQYTSLCSLPSIFTVGIHINTQNEFISLQDYDHYFNCADQLTQTYAAPYQKV